MTIAFNDTKKEKLDQVNAAKGHASPPAVNLGRHETKCTTPKGAPSYNALASAILPFLSKDGPKR
jgi:hypothetical protein